MYISIDWIKDYVDLEGISKDDLVKKYTLGTAEIESVQESNKYLAEIKAVEITNIEKHPEADKLNLVTFRLSESDTFRVVCGATNVREGLKVPYAPIGVTLPGNFTLTPKKIRGVLSEGMLCSAQELGLPEENDGLLELPIDLEVGTSMSNFLGKKSDIIFDIDNKSLTHRPDLWGHYGQAREFSALFEKPLKPYISKNANLKVTNEGPIKVRVDNNSCCIAYFGLTIEGVEVTDSPRWIKERLESAGINPKNSIVDISNYVMLDLGLPNHIFDADKIIGNISVHAIDSSCDFVSLDKETRKLIKGDTVVSDESGPLVIAGLIGGASTSVSDDTRRVFVEVATWKASSVRSTSTRLGLRTDSSQRFEKSLDPKLNFQAITKILEMIKELNPGAKVEGTLNYDGLDLESIKELKIQTSFEKINKVLGTNLSESKILGIFKYLCFDVEQLDNSKNIEVWVPSFRATKDIECEADLIEEIGRVTGYDNIKAVAPLSPIFPTKISSFKNLIRQTRSFLSNSMGAFEVFSYPLVGTSGEHPQSLDLELINFLSEDNRYMRDNLVNSIIDKVHVNAKHESKFNLFELGKVYRSDKKSFSKETYSLVIASYGFEKDKSPFLDLANNTESLLKFLSLPFSFEAKNTKFKNSSVDQTWNYLHPVEFLNIKLMGSLEGAIFSIHPLLLKKKKIKGSLSLAVLSLEKVEKRVPLKKSKFIEISKFPRSVFDCSVITDKVTSVKELISICKQIKVSELESIKVVGTYMLDESTKSVTLRFSFHSNEKTIDSNRIKELENLVIENLEKNKFFLKN